MPVRFLQHNFHAFFCFRLQRNNIAFRENHSSDSGTLRAQNLFPNTALTARICPLSAISPVMVISLRAGFRVSKCYQRQRNAYARASQKCLKPA